MRRLTAFLTVKDVVKDFSVENKSVNTQDDNMSETSDLQTDSETDEINYGPSESNVVQTEEDSVFIFDVKEESSVVKIYGDRLYRSGLTPDNKDHVMCLLAKEVLEQRAIMEWGRKLHILRKKCEGRKVDMVFLWSLQEAFNKKLGAYIVKGEDSESISSLMKHFSVGSLAAADLALISDLFHKFDENLSKLSEVEMVDLTVDDDAQEALKKSLAKLLLNEDERRVYESDALLESNKLDQELLQSSRRNDELMKENQNLKNLQSVCQEQMKSLMVDEKKAYESEALLERNKLDQELLQASRITDELRKENENLKNLQSVCEQQMESLMVVQKKRKEEKTSFDLFGKLPKKEVQYQSGDQSRSYKVHVLEDEIREDELKKEKRLKDMEMKEFKRKRKDEINESKKRMKLASSLGEELKNVDRNRKSMKHTEALYQPSRAHGSALCGEEACKKRQIENFT